MPGLISGEAHQVKKVVIKIAVKEGLHANLC
jgi:hypothetical protein